MASPIPSSNASTTSSVVDSLLEDVDGAVADDALSAGSALSLESSAWDHVMECVVNNNSDDADDDVPATEDITSLTPREMWELASELVWGVKGLRPIQIEAIERQFYPDICELKMLFIGRTGIGKSHFFRMLGCILGGIFVQIIPLLSLSANQMTKMKSASNEYGDIEAHNLDEICQ